MDYAMRRLFRPIEKYADPSILTVGIPNFALFSSCTLVLFSSCMLEFSSEFACLPFGVTKKCYYLKNQYCRMLNNFNMYFHIP
jgi:hypothetical protein